MRKIFLLVILFVSFVLPSFLQTKKKPELPEKFEKWIKEEIVYIITSKEKEVFYKLETDKERDLFIEQFWRQRDPSPGTPRNEFKEEHYRRIEQANKKFKRYTSLKGWRTDRGRIFIILGEPIQVEKFHQRTESYPLEIWTYFGNPKFGQAPIFRLLFVRKFGVGPFELYNPAADGPKSLTPLSSMRLPNLGALQRRGKSLANSRTLAFSSAVGTRVSFLRNSENCSFSSSSFSRASFQRRSRVAATSRLEGSTSS